MPTDTALQAKIDELEKCLAQQGEELQELKRFLHHSRDAVYRFDIRTRRFVRMNAAARRFYGANRNGGPTPQNVLLRIYKRLFCARGWTR